MIALGVVAWLLPTAKCRAATNYLDGVRDFDELARRVEGESPDYIQHDKNGAVEFIAVGAVSDENLVLISREPSVKKISLVGTRAAETGFAALQQMTNLSSLSVCGCNRHSNTVELASRLSQLRRLNLVATSLKPSDLPFLMRMTNLEELEMGNGWMLGSDAVSSLTNLPHLKKLDMGWDKRGFRLFHELRSKGSESDTNAATNPSDGTENFKTWAEIIESGNTNNIRRDEDGNVVYIAGELVNEDTLPVISRQPTIRKLIGMQWDISAKGMAFLEQMTNLTALTIIHSNGLQSASKLTQLRELHLSCSRLKVADLPCLMKLTNLEDLSIRGVWEMGAGGMSSLTNLTHLKKLIIGGGGDPNSYAERIAGFRTDGYQSATNWDGWRKPETSEIMALTNLPSLEELQIYYIYDFGDEYLRKLSAFPHLKSLLLNETRVSDNWTNIVSQFPALTNAEVMRFHDGEGREDQKWVRKE